MLEDSKLIYFLECHFSFESKPRFGFVKAVGRPPPPGVPGCGEVIGAMPGVKGWACGIINIINVKIVPTITAVSRGSGKSLGSIRHGSVDVCLGILMFEFKIVYHAWLFTCELS